MTARFWIITGIVLIGMLVLGLTLFQPDPVAPPRVPDEGLEVSGIESGGEPPMIQATEVESDFFPLIEGGETEPVEVIPISERFRVRTRFKLDTDVENLPKASLTVYRTKPDGGRTVLQTALAEVVLGEDGYYMADFKDVAPIRYEGTFTLLMKTTSPRVLYKIAEEPITFAAKEK